MLAFDLGLQNEPESEALLLAKEEAERLWVADKYDQWCVITSNTILRQVCERGRHFYA